MDGLPLPQPTCHFFAGSNVPASALPPLSNLTVIEIFNFDRMIWPLPSQHLISLTAFHTRDGAIHFRAGFFVPQSISHSPAVTSMAMAADSMMLVAVGGAVEGSAEGALELLCRTAGSVVGATAKGEVALEGAYERVFGLDRGAVLEEGEE